MLSENGAASSALEGPALLRSCVFNGAGLYWNPDEGQLQNVYCGNE